MRKKAKKKKKKKKKKQKQKKKKNKNKNKNKNKKKEEEQEEQEEDEQEQEQEEKEQGQKRTLFHLFIFTACHPVHHGQHFGEDVTRPHHSYRRSPWGEKHGLRQKPPFSVGRT